MKYKKTKPYHNRREKIQEEGEGGGAVWARSGEDLRAAGAAILPKSHAPPAPPEGEDELLTILKKIKRQFLGYLQNHFPMDDGATNGFYPNWNETVESTTENFDEKIQNWDERIADVWKNIKFREGSTDIKTAEADEMALEKFVTDFSDNIIIQLAQVLHPSLRFVKNADHTKWTQLRDFLLFHAPSTENTNYTSREELTTFMKNVPSFDVNYTIHAGYNRPNPVFDLTKKYRALLALHKQTLIRNSRLVHHNNSATAKLGEIVKYTNLAKKAAINGDKPNEDAQMDMALKAKREIDNEVITAKKEIPSDLTIRSLQYNRSQIILEQVIKVQTDAKSALNNAESEVAKISDARELSLEVINLYKQSKEALKNNRELSKEYMNKADEMHEQMNALNVPIMRETNMDITTLQADLGLPTWGEPSSIFQPGTHSVGVGKAAPPPPPPRTLATHTHTTLSGEFTVGNEVVLSEEENKLAGPLPHGPPSVEVKTSDAETFKGNFTEMNNTSASSDVKSNRDGELAAAASAKGVMAVATDLDIPESLKTHEVETSEIGTLKGQFVQPGETDVTNTDSGEGNSNGDAGRLRNTVQPSTEVDIPESLKTHEVETSEIGTLKGQFVQPGETDVIHTDSGEGNSNGDAGRLRKIALATGALVAENAEYKLVVAISPVIALNPIISVIIFGVLGLSVGGFRLNKYYMDNKSIENYIRRKHTTITKKYGDKWVVIGEHIHDTSGDGQHAVSDVPVGELSGGGLFYKNINYEDIDRCDVRNLSSKTDDILEYEIKLTLKNVKIRRRMQYNVALSGEWCVWRDLPDNRRPEYIQFTSQKSVAAKEIITVRVKIPTDDYIKKLVIYKNVRETKKKNIDL